MFKHNYRVLLAAVFMAVICCSAFANEAVYKTKFFEICDLACQELVKDTLHIYGKHHYKDSYSVRALAVAYDMTGDEKYLNVCKEWSDKMVELQHGMEPAGAYYMNYGRKPGEKTGEWFVADCASVAQGVLATAVRCQKSPERTVYIDSVKAYADLVIANYARSGGGITDGLWSKYDGPWWCSTGIFGGLAFSLYYETGDEKYLDAGYGAIDWLNAEDLTKTGPSTLEEQGPAMYMYVLEAYAAGLPFIQPGSDRYKEVMARYDEALEWMAKGQAGRGGEDTWDYNTQWGSKGGGLPFHMYIYAKHVHNMHEIYAQADKELTYVCQGPVNQPDKRIPDNVHTQLMNFTLMSLAERLSPGTMYRR
ncbi:hypothetical protein SMSP2_00239 [Limihaloglobus sulfuriphilus]|uniref:Uncharacterized protein n=1 Tax=Limihaloglobus sulfuriphilus TaxID=1851148 RepID=A0A1Q2MAZ9_9BACT|nr:hypothetical protein [Limihaloglobus sulfuriphilus]AQQ69905.1 hypothetical protein SMSP2_00239 [Limihaloglobus sulfuriphilus]